MKTRDIMSASPGSARVPDRRIGLRFRSVESLEQAFVEGIRHGYLAVPSADLTPTGHRVEVALTLPGCGRLLRIPTVVERTLSAGANNPRLMVLRLQGVGRVLPRLIQRYLDTCRGRLCGEAGTAAPGSTACQLMSKESMAGWQQRVAAPRGSQGIGRTGAARSRAGAGAEQIPRPKALTPTEGLRFDTSGSADMKAVALVQEACQALSVNDRGKAVRLLRIAVAYDPRNTKAGALLRFAQDPGEA